MLIQNAWAVTHKQDCFLAALFYRIASRRGGKRAAMAVAHRVLRIAYYILRDGSVYHELGGDHYDRKNPERTARRLTQRLERIGYDVTLAVASRPAADPAEPPPIRNGTTRWDSAGTRRAVKTQLPIPGPIATPEVCSKCAAWKIPCIHVRGTIGSRVQKLRRGYTNDGGAKPGRPCKCAERGIVCKHKNRPERDTQKTTSAENSVT